VGHLGPKFCNFGRKLSDRLNFGGEIPATTPLVVTTLRYVMLLYCSGCSHQSQHYTGTGNGYFGREGVVGDGRRRREGVTSVYCWYCGSKLGKPKVNYCQMCGKPRRPWWRHRTSVTPQSVPTSAASWGWDNSDRISDGIRTEEIVWAQNCNFTFESF